MIGVAALINFSRITSRASQPLPAKPRGIETTRVSVRPLERRISTRAPRGLVDLEKSNGRSSPAMPARAAMRRYVSR